MCTSFCGPFSGNDRRAEVVKVGPKMAPTPKQWRHSYPQPACGGPLHKISSYQQVAHFQSEFNAQLPPFITKDRKRHNGQKVRWLFGMRQLFCFTPAFSLKLFLVVRCNRQINLCLPTGIQLRQSQSLPTVCVCIGLSSSTKHTNNQQ